MAILREVRALELKRFLQETGELLSAQLDSRARHLNLDTDADVSAQFTLRKAVPLIQWRGNMVTIFVTASLSQVFWRFGA